MDALRPRSSEPRRFPRGGSFRLLGWNCTFTRDWRRPQRPQQDAPRISSHGIRAVRRRDRTKASLSRAARGLDVAFGKNLVCQSRRGRRRLPRHPAATGGAGMPVGIAASDRKLLLIGGGLLLVLLIATVILAPPSERFNSPVPSTYSAASHGAAAAYRLLSKLNYPVRRWENPPTQLDADSGSILLILAEPSQQPSANERRALADFVEEGGRVLFTGANIRSYFPDANVSSERADPAWQSFTPNIPSVLSRGAQHVVLQPQTYWRQLNASQLSIYGEPGSPAVVSWQLGDGQIVWWAGSTPLTNAGISREDNLVFLMNAVTNWSADEPYTIYWDEYFHGERSSLWSYVRKTSLAWGVLQIALLTVAR